MTTHLREYITYYSGLERPGYAVLVSGPWGVGKTHQVKALAESQQALYVSLFGAESSGEIHARVFAAASPSLKKAKKVLDPVVRYLAGLFGANAIGDAAPGLLQALLNRNMRIDGMLVFDDLERCPLCIDRMFGAINEYVESRGCNVIVVADESQLEESKPGYRRKKEKLIGQTVEVSANVDAATQAFIAGLGDEKMQKVVSGNAQTIKDVFIASRVSSLRVLRHAIEDIGRLCSLMEPDQVQNKEAMHEIVSMHVALNVEVRQGELGRDDLVMRRERGLMHAFMTRGQVEEGMEEPRFLRVARKHTAVDLASSTLSDDSLVEMLVEGLYRKETIQACLSHSVHFATLDSAPPWRRLMDLDGLTRAQLRSVVSSLCRQFEEGSERDPGGILHISALRLLMADSGESGESVDDAENACMGYIDMLAKNGELPANPEGHYWGSEENEASDGFGYWVRDGYKQPFDRIKRHLDAKMVEAFEAGAPALAEQLLELMRQDVNAFLREVSETVYAESTYWSIPILRHIEPKRFVSVWLGVSPGDRKIVKYALDKRYQATYVRTVLAREADWAVGVMQALEEAAELASGLSRIQIERLFPQSLVQLKAERETTG